MNKKIGVFLVLNILCFSLVSAGWFSDLFNPTGNVVEDNQSNILQCSDSDGGINYYEKGSTTGIFIGDSELITVTDICSPELNFVKDYYCNDEGYIDDAEFECPNGCVNGACVVYSSCILGYREDGYYCNAESKMVVQKASDSVCDNNFECESNLCLDSKCVDAGLLRRFIEWIKGLFS